jgi:hypothetical protein
MKKITLVLVGLLGLTLCVNAQEVSLYDSDGEAIAYIDYDEDATIFMWDGTPVAFIEKDDDDLCVFGFNGSFLGWYDNGIIYDKNGYAAGARKGAVNMVTKIERIKGIQKITPIRPITPITPIQPIFKSHWSNISLTEFLYFGKK